MKHIIIKINTLSAEIGLNKFLDVIEDDFDLETININPKTYKLVPKDIFKNLNGKEVNFRDAVLGDGPKFNDKYKKYLLSALKGYVRNINELEVQIE
jgi:hypothetical protein